MRYSLAVAAILYASCASAGPLDFLAGTPDAPGVVAGGAFGPSGNDYYGDMHRGALNTGIRPIRSAKLPRAHSATARKPITRS